MAISQLFIIAAVALPIGQIKKGRSLALLGVSVFIRAMRSSKEPVSPIFVILVAQISPMVLIGLRHGLTLRFVLWELWHGWGLFIQNRWSDYMNQYFWCPKKKPSCDTILSCLNILQTPIFIFRCQESAC